MKIVLRGWAVVAVGVLSIVMFSHTTFAQSANAQAEITAGIEAYKNARYDDAIKHFKNAAALEPQDVKPHMYLATALSEEYVPGARTDDYAEQAINEYNIVLELDPASIKSLKGIAYLELQRKHFDKAKEYYRKAINLDANDADTYYSIGVIDWAVAFTERMKLRNADKLKPEDPFVNNLQCQDLKISNQGTVEEGIEMLNTALQLQKDYDDAMAYMNLMYREKADIECDDMGAYGEDLETADHWVDMTMATKNARVAKPGRSRAPLPLLPIPK
jgi:tetratricopeptide (TPR) repeat protein